MHPDLGLESRVDSAIDLLVSAQQPDGKLIVRLLAAITESAVEQMIRALGEVAGTRKGVYPQLVRSPRPISTSLSRTHTTS
jgi:hypothetical protein